MRGTVAQAIDRGRDNSDHETKTQTEQAFQASFVGQFGDIGLIVGAIIAAVFFTLILLTGNTMAQAVRERIPEFAVLKTIGFSNRSVLLLVLAEAVLLIVLGGAVGLLLAGVAVQRADVRSAARCRYCRSAAQIWLRGLAHGAADRAAGRCAAGAPRHAPATSSMRWLGAERVLTMIIGRAAGAAGAVARIARASGRQSLVGDAGRNSDHPAASRLIAGGRDRHCRRGRRAGGGAWRWARASRPRSSKPARDDSAIVMRAVRKPNSIRCSITTARR